MDTLLLSVRVNFQQGLRRALVTATKKVQTDAGDHCNSISKTIRTVGLQNFPVLHKHIFTGMIRLISQIFRFGNIYKIQVKPKT